jgi:hypothetical protein
MVEVAEVLVVVGSPIEVAVEDAVEIEIAVHLEVGEDVVGPRRAIQEGLQSSLATK